jgi:hypothetical protein
MRSACSTRRRTLAFGATSLVPLHYRGGGLGRDGDLGVAELLNALYGELAAEGTSSRNVVAIEFDPARNTVDVLTGEEPHLRSYPDLISIFRAVRQTCSQDRIDANQLRRISFLEEEVKLELVSRSGDQRIIYSYPIEE